MSKKKAKPVAAPSNPSQPKKVTAAGSFDIEATLFKYRWIFLGLSMFLSLLITLLIFDPKVSIAGDDSAYVQRAFLLLEKGQYPNYQGPLYPIVLMLPMAIFGINVVTFKLLSVMFIVLFVFLFFKAFEKMLPYSLLMPLTFMMAINPYLLYYGTQTFNEAFFMMLMAGFLLFSFRRLFDEQLQLKTSISIPVLLGISFGIILLGLTRFIAFAGLGGFLVFFLAHKRFREAAVLFVSFAAFYGLHSFLSTQLFQMDSLGFEQQLETVLRVNPYDASQGNEDFAGFIQRIWDNTNLYISKTMYITLGLRAEGSTIAPGLSVFTITISLIAAYAAFRYSQPAFFLFLFIGAIVLGSFILLQKVWDQDRLIQAYHPFIIAFLIAGFYKLYEGLKFQSGKTVLAVIMILLSFVGIGKSAGKINDNYLARQEYLKGNTFYGMTPDYQNYLSLAKWTTENIPAADMIATRMPTVCWIYTGREFHGIWSVPNEDADSLLGALKEYDVKYMLNPSLRVNPNVNTGQTITTVMRYMYFIEQKYPGTFRLVQEWGVDEKSSLYQVNYPEGF
jgi:hypothetical protein